MKGELNRRHPELATRNWGDTAVVTVKRGGAEVRIKAELRRTLNEKR